MAAGVEPGMIRYQIARTYVSLGQRHIAAEIGVLSKYPIALIPPADQRVEALWKSRGFLAKIGYRCQL